MYVCKQQALTLDCAYLGWEFWNQETNRTLLQNLHQISYNKYEENVHLE